MTARVIDHHYSAGTLYSTVECDECGFVLNSGHHYPYPAAHHAQALADEHNATRHAPTMDDFTRRHLQTFVDETMWEDERDDFVSWVESLDTDDLDHYSRVGWPAARDAWRAVRDDLDDLDDTPVVEHGYHDGPRYLYPDCPLCQRA